MTISNHQTRKPCQPSAEPDRRCTAPNRDPVDSHVADYWHLSAMAAQRVQSARSSPPVGELRARAQGVIDGLLPRFWID